MPNPADSSMTSDEFEAMKARFIVAGDRLTDGQLLDLADCYHEMLRQRRAIRARHPSLHAREHTQAAPEPRSFSNQSD